MWGEKNAYLLCQVLLGGYIVLMFLFRHNGFNSDFWALTITAVLAGWLIFRSTIEKNEYYYFFGVDGILILQYLMLLAFSKISF
jgi:4-hydroxybenzoate polyprenyltransferase